MRGQMLPIENRYSKKNTDDIWFSFKIKRLAKANTFEDFPKTDFKEVAFIGKSNVGKSSLINALIGIPNKATVEDRPGTTRTIDWYQLNKECCFIDLPGYGFAYASQEAKDSWKNLMLQFLTTREQLKRVVLLLDSRHGIKFPDKEMMDLLIEKKIKFQIVLTKCDLTLAEDLARRHYLTNQEMQGKYFVQPIQMLSTKTGAGMDPFKNTLLSILGVKETKKEND